MSILMSKYEEDWGFEDPTGKSDEKFIKTAKIIEKRVKNLIKEIRNKAQSII